ncbi:MAG: hypothetical protein WDO12_06140 [Pseudomonadota bacterium]
MPRAGRQHAAVWSVAASVVVLGFVAVLALVTQRPDPTLLVNGTAQDAPATIVVDAPYEPAVVDLRQFEMTSALEDHIALLDAQISAARVYAASPERVRQMETTRAQLTDSLQRVSYAQTLLSF